MRAVSTITKESTGPDAAVAALLADLPRDQALGLRLLCLARAAAALHMGQTCAADGQDCASIGAGLGTLQTPHAGPRVPVELPSDSWGTDR